MRFRAVPPCARLFPDTLMLIYFLRIHLRIVNVRRSKFNTYSFVYSLTLSLLYPVYLIRVPSRPDKAMFPFARDTNRS